MTFALLAFIGGPLAEKSGFFLTLFARWRSDPGGDTSFLLVVRPATQQTGERTRGRGI